MSTKIEWTEETWNPTVGCDKVSAGCKHCYAIRMAWRLAHVPAQAAVYGDTVTKGKNGEPNWTGVVKVNETAMDKPFRFKKPTVFFVDSMSDLFHDSVPFEVIDRVFAVMAECPQHTFQVLTKRPQRMLEYFNQIDVKAGKVQLWLDGMVQIKQWPLPNVWMGVSAEDQKTYTERTEYLCQVPSAVRFVSCEPLLGRIDLTEGSLGQWLFTPITGVADCPEIPKAYHGRIHWVIAGGESGPDSRPVHPDWIRSLRDQCKEHGATFFFKQWGDWAPLEQDAKQPFWRWQDGTLIDGHALPRIEEMENSKSWDDGMWCIAEREEPCIFKRVGKAKNTKLLDGKSYTELPKTK